MLLRVNGLINSCLNLWGNAKNISLNEKNSIEMGVVISYIYIFVILYLNTKNE